MPLPPSLHPRWNVRAIRADDLHSLTAAEKWMGGRPNPHSPGRHGLLVEGLTPGEVEAIQEEVARQRLGLRLEAARAWVSGGSGQLWEFARSLAEKDAALGEALSTALGAFPGSLRATRLMGILNVTPDSFSDGGRWLDVGAAVARALEMIDQGADLIDVGGESTRPGADEISPEEELRRVLPVVCALRAEARVELSIDTRKSQVAAACLEAGADWINDVSGLTYDPSLAQVLAGYPGRKLVLMHSRARGAAEVYSTEWDVQGCPVYEDVVADTLRWLRQRAEFAVERGVSPENLWVDPGFGFGKTFDQNVEILRRLKEYTGMGLPVLIGTSRKSTIGRMLGDLPPEERIEGTAATVAWAITHGASAVRVHDVREIARCVRVTDHLFRGSECAATRGSEAAPA